MRDRLQCVLCAPPGSGTCKACVGTQRIQTATCVMCYDSRMCRHCNGTGFELTTTEKIKDVLLWFWFICWLAFISAFLYFGIWEYTIALSAGSRASKECLLLIIVTILLWIVFFTVDHRARSKMPAGNWKGLANLSILAGTILAVYTLLGLVFFIYLVPRLQ